MKHGADMFEDRALLVEAIGLIRQWMSREWKGEIELRVLGRSVLMVRWVKPETGKGGA